MQASVKLSSFYNKIVPTLLAYILSKSQISQNNCIHSFAILLFCTPNNPLGTVMNSQLFLKLQVHICL